MLASFVVLKSGAEKEDERGLLRSRGQFEYDAIPALSWPAPHVAFILCRGGSFRTRQKSLCWLPQLSTPFPFLCVLPSSTALLRIAMLGRNNSPGGCFGAEVQSHRIKRKKNKGKGWIGKQGGRRERKGKEKCLVDENEEEKGKETDEMRTKTEGSASD